jgi:ANTAR domain
LSGGRGNGQVYRIDANAAFELLLWRSQHTNTKVRALAAQIIADLNTLDCRPVDLQRQFHHVLLTSHERIDTGRGD